MTPGNRLFLPLVAVVCLTLALPASAKRNKRNKNAAEPTPAVLDKSGGGMIGGELAAGDQTLDSGEYFDVHNFELQTGQSVTVDLYSTAFDTYLSVFSPSGTATRNDDHEGSKDRSSVTLVADESGTWSAAVTSYSPGESGSYNLHVGMGEGGGGGEGGGAQTQEFSGILDSDDLTMETGEFFEMHPFEAQAGQAVVVDLRSTDFDTFLTVISPSGNAWRNDDHEGSKNVSRVETTADETGVWMAAVTSYQPGETGAYAVQVQLGGATGPAPVAPTGGPIPGSLAAGDDTLDTGEYMDMHSFEATAGQTVTVDLRSTAFDTFLAVSSPAGESFHNDDHEGSKDLSRVEMTVEQSGTYTVAVTSYSPGESGAYTLDVQFGGGGGGGGDTPAPTEEGVNRFSGSLAPGDTTIASGEYVDGNSFEWSAGEYVVVDLRSTAFDPWLEIHSPGGESWVNDDHEGDSTRSQIAIELTESGTYTVNVTTYKPGEGGAYDVAIRRSTAQAPATGRRVEQGTLGAGDTQLPSGEYADGYEFEGRPGQTVHIDLASTEFDTFVALMPPRGDNLENDDAPNQQGHSVIETTLTELGTYLVVVTSYKAGETGAYTLTIDTSAGDAARQNRDVVSVDSGQEEDGRLEAGDTQLEGGEYVDMYVFDGTAGQTLSVSLTSTEFDPFLGLLLPSGGNPLENDDCNNRRDQSCLEFVLQETGRYRIAATSYGAGETGAYHMSMQLTSGGGSTPVRPVGNRGRIFGVFVGISDYPNDGDDLPLTAADAVALQAAFIQGVGMAADDSVLLTDSAATMSAVREAITRLGAQAGPNDTFVFFYSGHGGRLKRSDFQQTDPDGMDETLMMVDGHIRDDAFNTILDGVNAGTTLILLDSCFAGGFSKDVITRPGRMGMFSSEEDVTSSLADKFMAGGYLAEFVANAVGEGLADDGDGQLTAFELCQYVHERYRADVKSSSGGSVANFVHTARADGYQHLVVDRGSIGPYQVLFVVGGK